MTTPRSPQIAIVTGSTKGIGKAIAMELIDRGIKVFGTGQHRKPLCAPATTK